MLLALGICCAAMGLLVFSNCFTMDEAERSVEEKERQLKEKELKYKSQPPRPTANALEVGACKSSD